MYQKSPEKTPNVAHAQLENTQDIPEYFHSARRVRRIAKISGACLALASMGAYYGTDVVINQQRERTASIELDNRTVESADLDSTAFSVYIDGYGSMNAHLFAEKVGPLTSAITTGPYYSANFGDAPIDTDVLANKTDSTAEVNSYEYVSFNGFSAGGILAIETAKKTIEATDLGVDAVFLTSSPSGVDSLREDRIEQLWWLNSISKLPGARHSSAIRWLISMVSDIDQYDTGDPTDFFKVWQENISEIQKRAEPGVAQLDDQALAIINADLSGNLEAIGALRGTKQMPVIVYLAAADPLADTSVDNTKASQDICEAAEKARLTCLVYQVPNAVHSIYHLDTESYAAILENAKEEIQTAIAGERTYYEHPGSFRPTSIISPLLR